jgi:hypothetical protein
MTIYADRALETSTTTGTGAFTLAGAVVGYQTLFAALGLATEFDYCIEAVDGSGVPTGEWEVGRGSLSGSTTLARTTVFSSSNVGALVSFSAGTKRVFITASANQVTAVANGGRELATTNGMRFF